MNSARSNHIELATQQWRKSAPSILSTSHCEFNGAHSCAHAQKTIPMAPIHSFTKQIVPSDQLEYATTLVIGIVHLFKIRIANDK